MLRAIENALAADAGGWEYLTNREVVLLKRCAALSMFCEAVENWTLKQGTPIGEDGAMLTALQKGYVAHANALTRTLTLLGLRPARPDRSPTLEQYLEDKKAGTAENGGGNG